MKRRIDGRKNDENMERLVTYSPSPSLCGHVAINQLPCPQIWVNCIYTHRPFPLCLVSVLKWTHNPAAFEDLHILKMKIIPKQSEKQYVFWNCYYFYKVSVDFKLNFTYISPYRALSNSFIDSRKLNLNSFFKKYDESHLIRLVVQTLLLLGNGKKGKMVHVISKSIKRRYDRIQNVPQY